MPPYTVAPRPILKRSSAASPSTSHNPHAVHFAPLTCYFSAHSSAVYDRSPIDIAPNSCTLPERGCPGRTYYNIEEDGSSMCPSMHSRSWAASANTKHPRAFTSCDIPPSPLPSTSIVSCPPLIQDFSSESEESDGFSPLPEPPSHQPPPHAYNAKGLAANLTRCENQYSGYYPDIAVSLDSTAVALSFLPHPPSPLTRSSYLAHDNEAPASPKSRHRRSSRSRERKHDKHDITRDMERMRVDDESTGESQHRGRRNKLNSRTKSSDRALSISSSFASFGVPDDGCLGGF